MIVIDRASECGLWGSGFKSRQMLLGDIQIWYHTFFGIKPPYPHITFYIVILTLFGNFHTPSPTRQGVISYLNAPLCFISWTRKFTLICPFYSGVPGLKDNIGYLGAVQIYYYPFFGNFWTPSPPSPSYTFGAVQI